MKIIFGKDEGIPGFFKKTANMKKSAISNDSVDVFIGVDEVVFYPKSGRVAAFFLSRDEIEIISGEIWDEAIAFPS